VARPAEPGEAGGLVGPLHIQPAIVVAQSCRNTDRGGPLRGSRKDAIERRAIPDSATPLISRNSSPQSDARPEVFESNRPFRPVQPLNLLNDLLGEKSSGILHEHVIQFLDHRKIAVKDNEMKRLMTGGRIKPSGTGAGAPGGGTD
jgi:hypothetical protein